MSVFRCEACGANWSESAFHCSRCGGTVAVEVEVTTPALPAWLAAVLGDVDPSNPEDVARGFWRLDWLSCLVADVEAGTVGVDPQVTAVACRELRVMYNELRTAAEAEILKVRTP